MWDIEHPHDYILKTRHSNPTGSTGGSRGQSFEEIGTHGYRFPAPGCVYFIEWFRLAYKIYKCETVRTNISRVIRAVINGGETIHAAAFRVFWVSFLVIQNTLTVVIKLGIRFLFLVCAIVVVVVLVFFFFSNQVPTGFQIMNASYTRAICIVPALQLVLLDPCQRRSSQRKRKTGNSTSPFTRGTQCGTNRRLRFGRYGRVRASSRLQSCLFYFFWSSVVAV